jgi:UDP-2,3-diacylglucosamine hydrolase
MLTIEAQESRLRVGNGCSGFGFLQRVFEYDPARHGLANPAPDSDHVIETGALPIADGKPRDDQTNPCVLEFPVAVADLSEMFGPGDVEPDHMAGVVDHPHLIGFGIVHSDGGDGFGRGLVHRAGVREVHDGLVEVCWRLKGRWGQRKHGPRSAAPFRPPAGPPYLRPVHCQRLVVVGDAHLGRTTAQAEAAFLAFLDAVPQLGDGLLITGDLFEFWFSYHRAIPRRGTRVVAALAHLARTVPILMTGGNHDRWGGRFWEEELGIAFHDVAASFKVGGRPGWVTHGDGISETHWSAAALHALLSHRAVIALFRAVHPDLGLWLVDRLSGWLRDRDRTPEEMAASAARQQAWARARLAGDPALDLLVMGHTHRAAAVEVSPGRLYLNPGAWFDGYRFAVVSAGRADLRQFTP